MKTFDVIDDELFLDFKETYLRIVRLILTAKGLHSKWKNKQLKELGKNYLTFKQKWTKRQNLKANSGRRLKQTKLGECSDTEKKLSERKSNGDKQAH